MPGKGKPFTKNDPRTAKARLPGVAGRKKKTVEWREAEEDLREAIPRLLLMRKNDLETLLRSNPTGSEMLAAKYIHESPVEAVNRFLGKTASVLLGPNGGPVVPATPTPVLPAINFDGWKPEQIDAFIEATKPAAAAPPRPPNAKPA